MDVDGKGTPFRAQHGRLLQYARHGGAVQRCRHHEDAQRIRGLTEQRTSREGQREPQIRVQAALVEFVEDQQARSRERGVVLQHAVQDALGDHFDPRSCRDFRLETHAVAHGETRLLAQKRGHAFCRSARGHAAGFQHQDALPGEPGFVEQRERHQRGLARAGRGFQHELCPLAKAARDPTQQGRDR